MNDDDLATQDGQPTLAGMLAALPDPWTLLRDRRIGTETVEPVQIVLIHPEIGIALVEEAPGDPAAQIAALRSYLEGQGFEAYFPGDLPIVALSVSAEDLAGVGERLATAFDAAPRLSIVDRDWADAVIELLLVPDDLAMAPIGEPPAPRRREPAPLPPSEPPALAAPLDWAREAPELPPERRIGPALDPGEIPMPLMVDWPFAASHRPKRRWGRVAAATMGAVVLAGVGVAAWQDRQEMNLATTEATQGAQQQVELALPRQNDPGRSVEASPAAQKPPPVPPAPPVVLAQKPMAPPPPPPPVPTRVEPLPQTAAKAPPPANTPPTPPVSTANAPPAPPGPATQPANQTAASNPTPPSAPARNAAPSPPEPPKQTATAEPPRAAKAPPRIASAPKPKRPSRVAAAEPVLPKPPPEPREPGPLGRGGPPINAADLPPLDDAPATQLPPVATAAPPPASEPPPAPSALGPPVALRPLPASSKPPSSAAADPNPRECRPYTSNTTLTGRGSAVQGIACRGPDGQWRLVSEVPVR